jgi:hypothetical protein
MKENCLDIGIIQAFLDSELTHDETARVSAHIATCDNCALMLAEAEEESAIVFPALEREFNSLVPTQRLWNKINDSIRTEHESRPFWQKAWAFLSVSLASPSMAAASSLILVFAVFAALWINKSTMSVDDGSTNIAKQTSPVNLSKAPTLSDTVAEQTDLPEGRQTPRAERISYRPEIRREPATRVVDKAPVTTAGYMPGEESYVKTISTLNKTVEEQKDGVLRPSERIAYERDMAVVNDTIAKMKTAVKRNPKNESAKQILYSSYQNKIDLLNSVAQKEELVASLQQ